MSSTSVISIIHELRDASNVIPHLIKEVYSNFCMNIHKSFKLTQYLINIFKMRFPMINCLKYAQQCQNRIFKKMCQAATVPYSVMWISPRYYVNIGSMGNPLIPDAEKHALRPFHSLNLKIGM